MDNILQNSRSGFIGLYRSITRHWIYPKDIFTKYEAWIDLLLIINYEENKTFTGFDLEVCYPGETITSQQKLMKKWGWSKSKLLKFLEVLKKDHMLDFKSDNKKTTIKILNFKKYQDFAGIQKLKKDHKKTVEKLQKDYEKTIEDLTEKLQKATNNKEKKEKKLNILKRELEFKQKVFEFKDYSEEMLELFFNYWSQHGENDRKMLFEKKPSFEMSKRLVTWEKNNKKYEKQDLQTGQKKEGFSNSKGNFTGSEKTNIPSGNNKTIWS